MPESKFNLKKKRIRSFFLSFETSSKRDAEVEKIQNDLINVGLAYIQMKLPVDRITPELEAELRNKAEHNILHAKIREATEEDLESIMYLHNRAWLTANTPFRPITLDSIRAIYEYPDTAILIARVYGTDAGFIILDFEGQNKEFGVIAGLGIIPRFQRKGLGSVLGMAGWDYLKMQNIKELRCEVYIENKASYNFIKSLGFEEIETKIYKMEDFHLKDNEAL